MRHRRRLLPFLVFAAISSLWSGCSRQDSPASSLDEKLVTLQAKLDANFKRSVVIEQKVTDLARMEEKLIALQTKLDKLQADTAPGRQIDAIVVRAAGIEQKVTGLAKTVDTISDRLKSVVSDAVDTAAGPEPDVEFHTTAEAEQMVAKLGAAATAERVAELYADIDMWLVKPEHEKAFLEFKLKLASQLRGKVKQEVAALQKAALESPTGKEASQKHADAGRLLSLYPMSDEKAVIEETTKLSFQQAEIVTRLEQLRRQRYNRWATGRVEKAIDGYNDNSSYWSPKKENAELIASLVESLKEVDPVLLEPAVLELYNYVIDLTKGSISQSDKLDLAKRLSEPTNKRKTLGDF